MMQQVWLLNHCIVQAMPLGICLPQSCSTSFPVSFMPKAWYPMHAENWVIRLMPALSLSLSFSLSLSLHQSLAEDCSTAVYYNSIDYYSISVTIYKKTWDRAWATLEPIRTGWLCYSFAFHCWTSEGGQLGSASFLAARVLPVDAYKIRNGLFLSVSAHLQSAVRWILFAALICGLATTSDTSRCLCQCVRNRGHH